MSTLDNLNKMEGTTDCIGVEVIQGLRKVFESKSKMDSRELVIPYDWVLGLTDKKLTKEAAEEIVTSLARLEVLVTLIKSGEFPRPGVHQIPGLIMYENKPDRFERREVSLDSLRKVLSSWGVETWVMPLHGEEFKEYGGTFELRNLKSTKVTTPILKEYSNLISEMLDAVRVTVHKFITEDGRGFDITPSQLNVALQEEVRSRTALDERDLSFTLSELHSTIHYVHRGISISMEFLFYKGGFFTWEIWLRDRSGIIAECMCRVSCQNGKVEYGLLTDYHKLDVTPNRDLWLLINDRVK